MLKWFDLIQKHWIEIEVQFRKLNKFFFNFVIVKGNWIEKSQFSTKTLLLKHSLLCTGALYKLNFALLKPAFPLSLKLFPAKIQIWNFIWLQNHTVEVLPKEVSVALSFLHFLKKHFETFCNLILEVWSSGAADIIIILQ